MHSPAVNFDHNHVLTSIRTTSQMVEYEITAFMAQQKVSLRLMKLHGRLTRMPDGGEVLYYKDEVFAVIFPPEFAEGRMQHRVRRLYK
jgi:hypothetical protein